MRDYTQVPTQSADSQATPSASPASDIPSSNLPVDPIVADPNRPVSTISADSPQATPSAQPQPNESQVQPIPEPDLQPNQVLEGSASADLIPPAVPVTTPSASIDSQPIDPLSPQSP